jgi:hypothetical protein
MMVFKAQQPNYSKCLYIPQSFCAQYDSTWENSGMANVVLSSARHQWSASHTGNFTPTHEHETFKVLKEKFLESALPSGILKALV